MAEKNQYNQILTIDEHLKLKATFSDGRTQETQLPGDYNTTSRGTTQGIFRSKKKEDTEYKKLLRDFLEDFIAQKNSSQGALDRQNADQKFYTISPSIGKEGDDSNNAYSVCITLEEGNKPNKSKTYRQQSLSSLQQQVGGDIDQNSNSILIPLKDFVEKAGTTEKMGDIYDALAAYNPEQYIAKMQDLEKKIEERFGDNIIILEDGWIDIKLEKTPEGFTLVEKAAANDSAATPLLQKFLDQQMSTTFNSTLPEGAKLDDFFEIKAVHDPNGNTHNVSISLKKSEWTAQALNSLKHSMDGDINQDGNSILIPLETFLEKAGTTEKMQSISEPLLAYIEFQNLAQAKTQEPPAESEQPESPKNSSFVALMQKNQENRPAAEPKEEPKQPAAPATTEEQKPPAETVKQKPPAKTEEQEPPAETVKQQNGNPVSSEKITFKNNPKTNLIGFVAAGAAAFLAFISGRKKEPEPGHDPEKTNKGRGWKMVTGLALLGLAGWAGYRAATLPNDQGKRWVDKVNSLTENQKSSGPNRG